MPRFLKFCVIAITLMAACSVFLVGSCLAQAPQLSSSSQDDALRKFLQQHLGNPYPEFEQQRSTRYSSAIVDLKEDGAKEVIVYITGRTWCGSGGCRMLILAPEGTSYRVVTETTITRPPIRVLTTKSNGWHDISVVVAGGGIQPGYEAILAFDGSTYPSNPSMPPARQLEGKAAGKIVIPVKVEGTSLYQ
jgi:hypothetical protein